VIVDHRPQLDLLDLDDLLLLARFGGFLLRLIFVFAEIENLADRRDRVWRDLRAALISVTPLLAPSLSMSWTSRTRISSLMRGPSLAAGCGVLIGRRMVPLSYVVATGLLHPTRTTMDNRPRMLIGEHRRSGVFAGKSTTIRCYLLPAGAVCSER
jgi:hypothetical protein